MVLREALRSSALITVERGSDLLVSRGAIPHPSADQLAGLTAPRRMVFFLVVDVGALVLGARWLLV